jgi:hypothetical protein
MSKVDQIGEDLRFVSQAVNRQKRGFELVCGSVYYVWAAYIAIGYTLIDVDYRAANWFFALAWIPGALVTAWVAKYWRERVGEKNYQLIRRAQLHWFVGSLLCCAAVIGLACTQPAIRGVPTGQISVLLFGILWFTAGIHLDRTFLVLGPLFMVGGIFVGMVPHHGWTILGWLAALGLVIAGILASRRMFGGEAQ